jgi:hypothetical protein
MPALQYQQDLLAHSAGDRRWLAILEGRVSDYHGEAVNPKFLSVFETILGYGRRYGPADSEESGMSELQKAAASQGQRP